jgi:hypothetical protein
MFHNMASPSSPAVARQGVHPSGEPVLNRHDEHRRPVDRAGRYGHAPPVRVRRTGPRTPDIAARLLDELNRRLADSDAAIGPSYLIGEKIYQLKDGLDRVWQYEIMPLLEDLFYGQRDLDEFYGLSSLRTAIAATPTEP